MQNKFFGSKLNTVLLIILIILMVIALYWMHGNRGMYKGLSNNLPDSYETGYMKDQDNYKSSDNAPKMTTNNSVVYEGKGFSFSYDPLAKVKSGTLSNGSYVELTKGNMFVQVHFYPNNSDTDTNPFNFHAAYTETTQVIINGKTWRYRDTLVEGGKTAREYFYISNEKVIVVNGYINDLALVNLGSIEIK